MVFIGDVEQNFTEYFNKILDYKIDSSIQIGDMRLGFNKGQDNVFEEWTKYLSEDKNYNNKFIRGNHDNPKVCKTFDNYLGDFGYLPDQELFYISGAWSIDYRGRELGKDIFDDEELSDSQWEECYKLYCSVKPKFVCSHDVPFGAYSKVADFSPIIINKTSGNLEKLFSFHQPEEWIHGHHHKEKFYDYCGTKMVCLSELGMYENKNIKDF